MKLSLGWIADFVDLGGVTPEQVAELLSLHVAEVEGLARTGESIADVLVGEVVACGRHPDADKLSVTKVAFGGAEAVDVVCGASNVRAGLKVAFAPVGAALPGGLKIKAAKLRGAPSVGMICSERELELSEEHSGILELPADAPVGAKLVDYLGLRDAVLELDNKSLTHRPDLWGHYGFARELAAILRRPLRPLDHDFAWPAAAPEWRIELADADCPLYLGVPIRLPGGPRPSPRAIRARLLAVGARPRNDAVDLTNYVLFETGQPLHAFDAAKLRGGVVRVRAARGGETLATLDGETRALDGSELVIADDERAVALAGVIGGAESAVQDGSERLLLEAAAFRAARVRRAAQRFALRTDASSRYEKSLDPLGVEVAARRYCLLLRRARPDAEFAAAPARAGAAADPALRVAFDPARCAQRLGVDPGADETRGILERLGFGVAAGAGGAWQVRVPSWRATKDVAIEADLIEEVGRLHGYHRIAAAPLQAPVEPPRERPGRRLARRLASRLIGAHRAHETQAYAFLERAWVKRLRGDESAHLRVVNPVQSDADLIRRDPIAALLQQAHENARERAAGRIFENARGYEPRPHDEPRERAWLGFVAWQRQPVPLQGPASLFAQVRCVAEDLLRQAGLTHGIEAEPGGEELAPWLHPAHALRWRLGGTTLAWGGRADPRVVADLDGERVGYGVLLLDLEALHAAAASATGARFRAPARMPAVKVDVALAVPAGRAYAEIEAALLAAGGRLLESLELFDLYEGGALAPGQRSLAFHAVLRAADRTLEDRDEQAFLERVKLAAEALGGHLRS